MLRYQIEYIYIDGSSTQTLEDEDGEDDEDGRYEVVDRHKGKKQRIEELEDGRDLKNPQRFDWK